MTESGKVARNSDGQLRFVQSAGSSWWCLSSSSPRPSSVSSRGTETRPPLRSAPFCLFDAGSRYVAQMSLELGNPLTSAHRCQDDRHVPPCLVSMPSKKVLPSVSGPRSYLTQTLRFHHTPLEDTNILAHHIIQSRI